MINRDAKWTQTEAGDRVTRKHEDERNKRSSAFLAPSRETAAVAEAGLELGRGVAKCLGSHETDDCLV